MRRLAGLALLVVPTMPTLAHATDQIIASRSRWNTSHTLIWSDVVVQHDDGTRTSETIPGGSVDGIAMIQFASSSEAQAVIGYVRERNSSKVPLRWASSCVFLTPDAAGTPDLPMDQVTEIEQGVLTAWMSATSACSYLQLMLDAPVTGKDVGYDGTNLIIFRHDDSACTSCATGEWCAPAHDGDAAVCHPAGDFAITTLFYIDKAGESDDGTILDADIEMNGVNWTIATGCETICQSSGDGGPPGDLGNTLTHEVGHVMGLDHTCYDGDLADRTTDSDGDPTPLCSDSADLPAYIPETTMFPYEDPGETKKKTPEADDIAGVCAIYPPASDPKVCEPVGKASSGCHCDIGHRGAPPFGATMLLVAMGLACSRIRRR